MGLIVVTAPLSSRADPTDLETIASQARDLVGKRQYQQAIDLYMKAYSLSKATKYLRNVSVLYLFRLDDPYLAWEYVVRAEEQAESDTDRSKCKKLLKKVETKLMVRYARILITATPHDVKIRLGGRNAGGGPAYLRPGEHEIKAQANGHEPYEERFTVQAGEIKKLSVHLKPLDAWVRIQCSVPECSILLDGKSVGAAPAQFKVVPGSHELTVEAEGREKLLKTIILKPGEKRTIVAEMTAIPVTEPEVPVVFKKAPPRIERKWAWVSIGTGGGVVVAGVVLAVLGNLDSKSAGNIKPWDYNTYPEYSDAFESKKKTAQTKAYTGYGLLGLGVAAVGAGVALCFLSEEDTGTAVIPSGPGGPGITAMMRW